FEWVQPETGWQEMYTAEMTVRLASLRAPAFPSLDLGDSGFAIPLTNGYTASALTYLGSPAGTSARTTLLARIDGWLQRATFETPQTIASRMQALPPLEQIVLRFGLDMKMAQLSEALAAAPPATDGPLSEAVVNLSVQYGLAGQLYSQLNHFTSSGDY